VVNISVEIVAHRNEVMKRSPLCSAHSHTAMQVLSQRDRLRDFVISLAGAAIHPSDLRHQNGYVRENFLALAINTPNNESIQISNVI